MKQHINTHKWFYLFISLHAFCWTLIPMLVRYVLPMDALEGVTWGQHLAWGYDKNPFMNAWLTRLAVDIGGQSGWAVYLIGQLFVILCFWAVWKLARKIVSPVHALIAVLLLECITNYNIDAIDFGDNVLQIGLWAVLILCFYSAVQKQKIHDWVLVGILAGLSMMTKYYCVVLLMPMFVFLLLSRDNRQSFIKPGIYFCLIIFTVIIVPHFIWLFSHDFITIRYAFQRTEHVTFLSDHFTYAINFILPMLEACLPPLIIFSTLYIGKKQDALISEKREISVYQWQFLLMMGFGPLIVTLLFPVLLGMRLHPGWSAPLMSLWGIMLLTWAQPKITKAIFYRFMGLFFVLFFILLTAYSVAMFRAGKTSSANYPGQMIASKLTNAWHNKYHKKLFYVVGPRWEAGNISFYSKDRPSVYMSGDSVISFWIDEKDLRQKGALFIWPSKHGYFPEALLKRFPRLKDSSVMTFYWMRDKSLRPVKIYVSYLPPR